MPITISLSVAMVISCSTGIQTERTDYREEMKALVFEVAAAARTRSQNFQVIVNNGEELATRRGTSSSGVDTEYASIIDGFLIESLFFGYAGVDEPTPVGQRNTILPYLFKLRDAGVPVLVIDYCAIAKHRAESLSRSQEFGFLSYPSPSRELDSVPSYDGETTYDFLYLINPGRFDTLGEMVTAIDGSPSDLVVIDLYYAGTPVPKHVIEEIRSGAGISRRVYAYMSVGEASTFRYYWSSAWNIVQPEWIASENPHWPGSYRVRYWHNAWKRILIYDTSSYLNAILEAGFDGVVLDGIDTYQYFETYGE